MDFDLFIKIATKAYKESDHPSFALSEVLHVFSLYFETYKRTFEEDHPPLKLRQIKRIIEEMPLCIDAEGSILELPFTCYEELIMQHFKTQYKNCDYHINHFFSGRIRAQRFYETCYYAD